MSIKLEHLNYVYSQGTAYEKQALKDICLEIPHGEFVGVIGHTGSGKSTLIQHLNGLIKATSGALYYNGENIEWNVPSLGYILGDEGSAAVLGKKLVGDLLKNQLGDDLKQTFFTEYETSMADIIEKVYRQPFPNRFLAKLSRFCADHIDDERIYALVYDHFVQFIRRNLLQYKTDTPIGFVGSIAFYYRPILEKAKIGRAPV